MSRKEKYVEKMWLNLFEAIEVYPKYNISKHSPKYTPRIPNSLWGLQMFSQNKCYKYLAYT
jgi:hypothetical protein